MRNLQIIGNVPQVRRKNNFGEYAEEAVIIEEQPKVKKENPHFLEANTMEVTMQHLKDDCITPVFACNKQILNRQFSVKLNRHMIFETPGL